MMNKHTAKSPRDRASGYFPQAFTLVELLIATTVTLLLVLAITQAFAIVGETVTNSRATLEMAGQLRGVSQLVQRDFSGFTAPRMPWLQSSTGSGYIEVIDGPSTDLDSNANGTADVDELDPLPPALPLDRSRGDVDDVLMYTVRNDNDPFRGQVGGSQYRSNVAEIAMWVGMSDINQNGVQDPEDSVSILYRRVLLIRPDLNNSSGWVERFPSNPANSYTVNNQASLQQMAADLIAFYNNNDISVRFFRQESGTSVRLYAIANDLSDLTLRQNRFCHDPIAYQTAPAGPLTYVPAASLSSHFPHPANVAQTTITTNAIAVPHYAVLSLTNVRKTGVYLGQDVVMSNVQAFDVRCYDPLAPLVIHRGEDGEWGVAGVDDDGDGTSNVNDTKDAGWPGSDDECLAPGDLAFQADPANFVNGYGAFVDLNYKTKYGIVATYGTFFETTPALRSGLISGSSGVYDTWPGDYEFNGVDEDNDGAVDEGADGIDSDGVLASVATASNPVRANYGVDDPAERETSPPYAVPLVGLQVTIRLIDPATRQVRQALVTQDLFNE